MLNEDENNKAVNKTNKNIPELLSIHQAAKITGIGRNNLAFLIKHCNMPVVKIPGYSRIKIHYSDLLEFINSNKFLYKSKL
ncbi:MAG: helix-turn-helix domain-containing protein [Melioribacteraceae bacterium]|nr:helix-turn-helix domain-containing protein [Melioribacteraceae bacterium]